MCKAPNTMKTIKLYVKRSSIILLKNRNDPGPEKLSYIMKSPDPNEHYPLSIGKPDPIVCNTVPNWYIRKTIPILESRRSNTGKPKIQVLESHKSTIRPAGNHCRTLSIDRSCSWKTNRPLSMKSQCIQFHENQSKSDERLRNSINRHITKFTIQPL